MSYNLPYPLRVDPASLEDLNAMSNTFAIDNDAGSSSFVGHRFMPFYPVSGKPGTTNNPDLSSGFYPTDADTILLKDYENLSLSNYSFNGFVMARAVKDITLRGTISGRHSGTPYIVNKYNIVIVVNVNDKYCTRNTTTSRNRFISSPALELEYVDEYLESIDKIVMGVDNNKSTGYYISKNFVIPITGPDINYASIKYVTPNGQPVRDSISIQRTLLSVPTSQVYNFPLPTITTRTRDGSDWTTTTIIRNGVPRSLTCSAARYLYNDPYFTRVGDIGSPSFGNNGAWSKGLIRKSGFFSGGSVNSDVHGSNIFSGDILNSFKQLKVVLPNFYRDRVAGGGAMILIAGGNIDMRDCTIDLRGNHYTCCGSWRSDTDGHAAGGGSVIFIAGGDIITNNNTRILFGGGEGGRFGSSGSNGGAGYSILVSNGIKKLPNSPPSSLIVPASSGCCSSSPGASYQETVNGFDFNKEINFGYFKNKLNYKKFTNLA